MMRMRWKSAIRLMDSSRLIILRWSIVHRQSQVTFPPPAPQIQKPKLLIPRTVQGRAATFGSRLLPTASGGAWHQ